MTEIPDEIKTTDRSGFSMMESCKQQLPMILENIDLLQREHKELSGFFKNPFSNQEMLVKFQKNIISPAKITTWGNGNPTLDFSILSMLYLFIISKTDETIKFKMGCTRKPKMRIKSLGYELGGCSEIQIFSVVAGFELERFLKVLLKEFHSDNETYKTEIFEMPVNEYNKLSSTLQKFCAETKSYYFGPEQQTLSEREARDEG